MHLIFENELLVAKVNWRNSLNMHNAKKLWKKN